MNFRSKVIATAALCVPMSNHSLTAQQSPQPKPAGNSATVQMTRAAVVQFAKNTKLDQLTIDRKSLPEIAQLINEALKRTAPTAIKPVIKIDPRWNEQKFLNPDGTVEIRVPRKAEDVKVRELRVANIPLEVALQYIGEISQCGFRYEADEIWLTPNFTNWGERKRCACGVFLDESGAHAETH